MLLGKMLGFLLGKILIAQYVKDGCFLLHIFSYNIMDYISAFKKWMHYLSTLRCHFYFKLIGENKNDYRSHFIYYYSETFYFRKGTHHLHSHLSTIKYLSHTVGSSCKPSLFWRNICDMVSHKINRSILGRDANSWCFRNIHSKWMTKEWENTQHTFIGRVGLIWDLKKMKTNKQKP